MTYKEIMEHIKFHRERIDELSDLLSNTDSFEASYRVLDQDTELKVEFDARKAIINEMMWRAEEIGKLDTCNKKRLITNLKNFRKKIGF